MKRITVKLPDELDLELRREAGRRGITISALIRESIETHFGNLRARELFAAGAGRSGRTDVSERIEEMMGEARGL